MKIIKLTKEEIKALNKQLYANACRSGCAFEEMQTSKKSCKECDFTKHISSIFEKINN